MKIVEKSYCALSEKCHCLRVASERRNTKRNNIMSNPTTANEIKSALIAHQEKVAADAAEKIQTETRDNVREKYQTGLDGWNKSWETFWAIADRCKFNDRFWIDGFSKFKNDYVSNVKHGANAAEQIWSYSIFLAGCSAEKTPELLHTFIPAEHFTA